MIKDYIKYEGKEYQVSTVNIDGMLETMIFPVENGIVSGSEVYKFRTFDASESKNKHIDVLENPEKYVSSEAIKEYLESEEEDFKVSDIDKFRRFFEEMNIDFVEREFNPKGRPSLVILSVCENHYDPHQYSASLDIRFDKATGKFMFFEPYGE